MACYSATSIVSYPGTGAPRGSIPLEQDGPKIIPGAGGRISVFSLRYEEEEKVPVDIASEIIENARILRLGGTHAVDKAGRTLLFKANVEATKLLLKHGADVHAVDKAGRTALYCANAEKTKLLLDRGAAVDAIDTFEQTPLFLARPEAVKILAEAGANFDHRDKEGKTVLSRAMCGFFDELDYMKGSVTTASLFAPSMLWAQKRVSALLQHSANPHSQSAEADTETAAAMIETRYLPYKKALSEPVDNAQYAGHRAAAAGALDAVAVAYLWNQRGKDIEKQAVTHGGKLGAATGIVASYCSDPASFRAIADALQIAQQRGEKEQKDFRSKEADRSESCSHTYMTSGRC